MELFWMATISITAIAIAVILGDKMDTKLCLKMEVRDRAKLKKQVEDLADEGILFAEECYCKGLVPLNHGKTLAVEYIKSVLKSAYRTKIIEQDHELEILVEERIEQAGKMEEPKE